MGKIDELIQQYCPDGVEFRKIKDVYKRIKGTPITATKMKEIANPTGSVRIFAGGKTVIDANEEDIPNANITRVPAVLVQSRGVIDVVYYEQPFTFKNEMWAYTTENKTSVKYLYYVMKSNVQTFRDAASGMGALPQISLGTTEDFEIPLPPLPVQEAIVNILDRFTVYAAELQAELQARQQQYNYYRDNLLSFEGRTDIEWKKIKDVVRSLTTGLNPRQTFKLNVDGATYPYITGKDIFNNSITPSSKTDKISFDVIERINKRAKLEDDMLLFASTGTGTVGRMAYIQKYSNDWSISETLYAIKTKSLLNTRYFMYYLTTEMAIGQYRGKISKGSVPHLKIADLMNVVIPIPSMEEQHRVVELLCHFDTLVNDITAGLPAEIEARRKQYEYYRDRLLTFNRKNI